MSASNGTNHLGVNLGFTKFLFVAPRVSDDATLGRIKGVAAMVARGYFNDYESEGSREAPTQDTIQFFTSTCPADGTCARAKYVVQISSKYRPRLQETEAEFRKRFAGDAIVTALDGALRNPHYTSAELHAYAYKNACPRPSARQSQTVIIIPMRKTPEWWSKSALERHTYFYPHLDHETLENVAGHPQVAEAGISTIFRRLYYNPDGHSRDGEFDFITYFECADAHLPVFDEICRRLRDVTKNPEWRFVVEGKEWRGRRVLRW